MPVYHFKLEDTVTGERRYVSVAADSKEEAEQTVLAHEAKKTNYQATDEEVKDLEAKLKAGTLSGRDKARLLTHRQEKPYKIQKEKGGDS
jgi:hypothetical protein